jgi:hypothetical protein
MLLGLAAILALAAASWQRAGRHNGECVPRVQEEALVYLQRVRPTAADRAAIRLAASDYAALERLASTHVSSLESGNRLDPRSPEIAEALEMIGRLRDVHAWNASSPEITRALLVLADANQHRLELLVRMSDEGFDADQYACSSKSIDRLWRRVLSVTDAGVPPPVNSVGLTDRGR